MGQARKRGTFIERKAQALGNRRIKRTKKEKRAIALDYLKELYASQAG